MLNQKSANLVFSLTFFSVVALDQLTKLLVASKINLNFGVSFGLKLPLVELLLTILLITLFFYLKSSIKEHPLALGLFFGGAVSNLIDRFIFGGVRDFLPIPFFHLTNNLADWAIGMGLVYVIILKIQDEVAKRSESQSN